MVDLAAFLAQCYRVGMKEPLVVVNTDNVPNNGTKIQGFIRDPSTLLRAELKPEDQEGEGHGGGGGEGGCRGSFWPPGMHPSPIAWSTCCPTTFLASYVWCGGALGHDCACAQASCRG